ncbi:MAG: hypothetical protein GY714_04065 [Desulfobacterales bacterium]|nr:hypothetical protein [Desulfobacterales bacterium]
MKSILKVFLLSILCIIFSCDEPDNPDNPDDPGTVFSKTLIDRFPVDGVINFTTLSNVQEKELPFLSVVDLKESHKTNLKWAMVNDDKEIYIAVEWTDDDHNSEYSLRDGIINNDFIQLLLDNNGNGIYEAGEDKKNILAASVSSCYFDTSKKNGTEDEGEDIIGDGIGYLRYYEAEKKYQAEFIIPLLSDSNNEDANINSGTKFNFSISDNFDPTGTELPNGEKKPSGFFTMLEFNDNAWPVFTIEETPPVTRPSIPDNLEGLIIFASSHEHPKGEIYTFNPQSNVVSRITNNDIYEGTISLSHNRDIIAFMGAPNNPESDSDSIAKAEIYTININSLEQKQLTGIVDPLTGLIIQGSSNNYLDGHPAWSPDDSKIVFGRYKPDANGDIWGAHIIVMNTDGTGKIDLTLISEPAANTFWCDEMDPEFLPDGRIVFKTNRDHHFTDVGDYSLYIAVMDINGGNYQRITYVNKVADHDPVGDLHYALFERMTGNYNYLELPGAIIPWQIVETNLDSKIDNILVDNDFVNWLPVYDPTGQYVVYIRSWGYSEARLIKRDGKDLGRLIPDVTKITYLDWK